MITKDFLDWRAAKSEKKGFSKQKWIIFCEVMLRRGYRVDMYEARRTVSKYVTVSDGKRHFKVRFSNHAPIMEREKDGDCDFFVGRTNFKVSTTGDAIKAVFAFFENYVKPQIEDGFEILEPIEKGVLQCLLN